MKCDSMNKRLKEQTVQKMFQNQMQDSKWKNISDFQNNENQ